MSWWRILFSFRGRLNRKPYWLAIIGLGLALVATAVAILMLDESAARLFEENEPDYTPEEGALWSALILTLATLAVTYANLAIGAKRLHDRNKSAWWLLVIVFGGSLFETASLLGIDAVGTEGEPTMLGNTLIAIGALISLWFFVELGFFKGTQGTNRFGDDPLGAKVADAGL